MDFNKATELFRRGIITFSELKKFFYNYIFESGIDSDTGLMRACEVDAWFDMHPEFKDNKHVYCEVGGLCTLNKTDDYDCELNPSITFNVLAYSGLEQHMRVNTSVDAIYEMIRDGFTVLILHK